MLYLLIIWLFCTTTVFFLLFNETLRCLEGSVGRMVVVLLVIIESFWAFYYLSWVGYYDFSEMEHTIHFMLTMWFIIFVLAEMAMFYEKIIMFLSVFLAGKFWEDVDKKQFKKINECGMEFAYMYVMLLMFTSGCVGGIFAIWSDESTITQVVTGFLGLLFMYMDFMAEVMNMYFRQMLFKLSWKKQLLAFFVIITILLGVIGLVWLFYADFEDCLYLSLYFFWLIAYMLYSWKVS